MNPKKAKLVRKKRIAKLGRKLKAVQEIGQYENGPWKVTLRFDDGTVVDKLCENAPGVMSYLAYLCNELLNSPSGVYMMAPPTEVPVKEKPTAEISSAKPEEKNNV